MSTDVMLFSFQDTPVRLVDVNGQPWFVLADLCHALGLARRPAAVAERLDAEVRQTYPIPDALGRTQDTLLVSEAGMYDVVLRSDAPTAKPFRRWITAEVLPSIRRTGTYTTHAPTPSPDVTLMSPDAILTLAQRLVDTTRLAQAAEEAAETSRKVVRTIEANDGITLTAFHKHYFSDVRETDFFEFLYARGLLINQRGARGRGPDGRLRDGREHRHPTAKGKHYLYLHASLDREGTRREHVRVRPGHPEVELVRFLHHRGLTPNQEALAAMEGDGLVEVAHAVADGKGGGAYG